MITISAQEAIDLLEQVVEGNEDFVYEPPVHAASCAYVHADQPSCMIGQALNKAGVPLNVLERMDACENGEIQYGDVLNELRKGGFILTLQAVRVFNAAQRLQDRGKTWGEALGAAREVYSHFTEVI